MKRGLKQLIAMICMVSITLTLPGMTVLAEEISSEMEAEMIHGIDSSLPIEDSVSDEFEGNELEESLPQDISAEGQDEINGAKESENEESSAFEYETENEKMDDSTVNPAEQIGDMSIESGTGTDVHDEFVEDEIDLVDMPSQTDLAAEMLAQAEADVTNIEALVGAGTSSSDPGFEVYNAEARIKGLEGNGNALYDILMNTDMIYQQLAEYAMEEKGLYYSSGLWLTFFDDKFRANPQYMYETILMAYLNFDANSAETKDTMLDAVLDFAVDLTSAALSQTGKNIDEWNDYISTLPVDDFGNLMMNTNGDLFDDMGEMLDCIKTFSNNSEEMLNNLAGVCAVDKKRKQQIDFLKRIRNRVTDNEPLKKAIDEIVFIYGDVNMSSFVTLVGGQTISTYVSKMPEMVWEEIKKSVKESTDLTPKQVADLIEDMDFVFTSAKVGASGLNALFGTKTLSKDLMAILTVYIIDTEFREALRESKQAYLNDPTYDNAVNFNGAFNSYLEYQLYASQVAKQYIHDIINSGLLTKTFAQICYTENIQNAEELTAICDSQMSTRKRMATFEQQYYRIYSGKYDKNAIIVAISGQNEPKEVPVTGISFTSKTRTIQLDNIWAEIDDVVIEPSNATNKGFKITCSDESILTVNSLYGWMTPMKIGTVTLTVTSDDGGFKDTQEVTVANDENVGGLMDRKIYSVGEKVRATVINKDDGFELLFYSDNGVLSKDWKEIIGSEILKSVKMIGFSSGSGVMYFPEDSSCLFGKSILDNAYYRINGSLHPYYCALPALTKLDLTMVDTSRVKNMTQLFATCCNLEELDLRSFDTSRVTDMKGMFTGCENLKRIEFGTFNTSKVITMNSMFMNCYELPYIDLDSFITSNVIDMSYMFGSCKSIRALSLESFDTSKVTNMESMFNYCYNLVYVDLQRFDTSKVTDMSWMFKGCDFSKLDVSSFNTSHVKFMNGMFDGCRNLISLDLRSFNTSRVTNMSCMFETCRSLTNINCENFDTAHVKDMSHMFDSCDALKSIDVINFDTSRVTNMEWMFGGCDNLISIDLSSFDTSNVKNMGSFFSGCASLIAIDISNFDTTNVNDFGNMFKGCSNIQILKTPMKNNYVVELPIVMYDSSGKQYNSLPIMKNSIVLGKTQKLALQNGKIDITEASVGGVSLSYGYSGKAYTPTLTVRVNDVTLSKGTDYVVKFEDNKDPGTAKIIITGKGKYTGTRIKTFEIVDCVSSIVAGKTYQLIPKNNSKTAVCSFAGRMTNNTKVYITDRSNSEAMKFMAVKNSDGTWKFINAKCKMSLAVQQNSSVAGKGLVLYDQTTKKAQNWKLTRKSDNSFAITNAVSGLYISMSDMFAPKGTTLSIMENSGRGDQRFYIVETSAVSAPFDGIKTVRASKDNSFGLNIAESSKTDGANVNLYKYSNTNANKFKIIYSGGGYYRLMNVNSGLVLTVSGNTKTNGANIIQSKWAGESGQRWKISKNSDGSVTLRNALGTVLHLNGNKTVNGTNVVARNAATTTAQRWYLQ